MVKAFFIRKIFAVLSAYQCRGGLQCISRIKKEKKRKQDINFEFHVVHPQMNDNSTHIAHLTIDNAKH